MKVNRVFYQRLFTFSQYENERIGFDVELEDGDNAKQIIGNLFFEVMNIEEAFEAYRQTFSALANLADHIQHQQLHISRIKNNMDAKRATIDQLAERGTEGDVEARLQRVCEMKSMESLKEDLARAEKRMREYLKRRGELRKIQENLKKQVKHGQFYLSSKVKEILKEASRG